jgi:diaminopimelate dehydrogenase
MSGHGKNGSPLRLAVIGFGRLGRACAAAIAADEQLTLAGIVRRPESAGEKLPGPFARVPVATHVAALGKVDAALVCVPTEAAPAAAHDLLQHGIPVVECAELHGEALREHRRELGRLAARHGTVAIVGAGWDPGACSLFRALFALLIPRGHTDSSARTAPQLHHTTAARAVPGVREALATELGSAAGERQRYLYVELEPGADPAAAEAALRSDPLFLGEQTRVFVVESLKELEAEGDGVLLERRAAASAAFHPMLLLEARFSGSGLAAAVMVAAARALPGCKPGAHTLFDLPPGALWGALRVRAEQEWL